MYFSLWECCPPRGLCRVRPVISHLIRSVTPTGLSNSCPSLSLVRLHSERRVVALPHQSRSPFFCHLSLLLICPSLAQHLLSLSPPSFPSLCVHLPFSFHHLFFDLSLCCTISFACFFFISLSTSVSYSFVNRQKGG